MFASAVSAGVLVFISVAALAADWPQWRGPSRDSITGEVPTKMPEKKVLWRRPMAGKCSAGVAVSGGFVIVPDHGDGKDYLRCYRAEKGEPAWTHSWDNDAEMEYTSGPRATPLVHEGMVYALGATGQLCCLKLDTGTVVWQMNLAELFKAEVPQYGYCSSPIIVDGKLIVNPGGKDASVAALDPKTGKTIWQTPGAPAAYASFIVGTFGGVRQIVGYDSESLGGWDPATGKRLWKLVPPTHGDFNVGTPVDVAGKLLVCTENNYTRLHGFSDGGAIIEKPLARNDDLGMDMGTPTVVDGLAFGTGMGLVCMDANDGLKTLWASNEDDSPRGFSHIIAGNGHALIFCENGTMHLLAVDRRQPKILGSVRMTGGALSHPALADGRLYIRDDRLLYCYNLR
ncbi:MAG TPA: PQQ-binding-like beta-propeller repeat protein [Planctomycetota bacterium]|nr:PQQ-binding-like beta-propeller repeat protein [Planctomycetota bacterium]